MIIECFKNQSSLIDGGNIFHDFGSWTNPLALTFWFDLVDLYTVLANSLSCANPIVMGA